MQALQDMPPAIDMQTVKIELKEEQCST
jgi:hypothetical protein